jgi:hypothetical protein
MVEVFKTNVKDQQHAAMLIDYIHKNFTGYKANFDLEDCDKILRVKSAGGFVQAHVLIDLLHDLGFAAEILPDDNVVGIPIHQMSFH